MNDLLAGLIKGAMERGHDVPKIIADVLRKNAKAFHDHLDVCAQCRERPFNLCPAGAQLLKDATKHD